MSKCHDCPKLIQAADAAGGGTYKCKDYPGIVLGEWGHWTDKDEPNPICTEGEIKMSEKLLPCPFCGGEVELEEIPGSPFTLESRVWGVGCKDCNIGWYKETKTEAIAAWNRRAPLPMPPEGD